MHTSQQQNCLENLFNSIKCKNQEFLREKRIKYGYDFELDRPLSDTKIKKVLEYSKEENKKDTLSLNLTDLNFDFIFEENRNSFKDEARKILVRNIKNVRAKKVKEVVGLKESSDLNSKV